MIKSFRGVSLVDFPLRIASVIYTYGCNFRCPYCYNLDLILPERYKKLPDLELELLIETLSHREGFIQGIVITGGEPTLWGKRLLSLLETLKAKTNLPIKLDTNGSFPEVLQKILAERLVDYVAVDIKTSQEKYPLLSPQKKNPNLWFKIGQTLELLSEEKVDWEVRITLYPPLVEQRDLEQMVPLLKRAQRIALQKYLPTETLGKFLEGQTPSPYTYEEMYNLYTFLQENLPEREFIKRF